MAKKRPDYESSLFSRFLNWLTAGSDRLDAAMAHTLDDQATVTDADFNLMAQEREARDEARRTAMAEQEKSMYAHVHAWMQTRGKGMTTWMYRILAVVICVSLIALLLITAAELPPFGSPDNPANNEVSERYIEKGQEEPLTKVGE